MTEPRKPTEFEMAVYQAVSLIPMGKVSSYGRIAQKISRGTPRSVGSALAKNPFAPKNCLIRIEPGLSARASPRR